MPQGIYLPEGSLLHTPQNMEYIQDPRGLEKAFASRETLEAVASVCDKEHNLICELGGGVAGIISRNEAALGIEEGKTRDIAIISRVGKPVCFQITDISHLHDEHPTILLSRRNVQQEAKAALLSQLRCGEVIRAKVTHLESFGCFADIGRGMVSLIGIENISVSRIAHSHDRFETGQDIYAAVLNIDKYTERISLTHKELLGTWEENAAGFETGETVRGIVRGVEDYGMFVELAPNLSGLADKKAGISIGQRVSVFIKNIMPERMKIKLVVIDAFPPDTQSIEPLRYFITSGRLDYWRYTPLCCDKMPVATIFQE